MSLYFIRLCWLFISYLFISRNIRVTQKCNSTRLSTVNEFLKLHINFQHNAHTQRPDQSSTNQDLMLPNPCTEITTVPQVRTFA